MKLTDQAKEDIRRSGLVINLLNLHDELESYAEDLREKLEEFAAGARIEAPVKKVKHKSLELATEESPFKVKCPDCLLGVLLVARDDAGQIAEYDNCILCGQRVQYEDIERLRAIDARK